MHFRIWIEQSGLDRVYLNHPVYGKETVGEFLSRHRIPIEADGTITFYHGRPKGSNYNELKAGTYITTNQKSARYYASNSRGIDPNEDVEVLTLKLTPDQIEPGIHITLRTPVQI